jgi:hypothetical protein
MGDPAPDTEENPLMGPPKGYKVLFVAGKHVKDVFVRSDSPEMPIIEARARQVLNQIHWLPERNWTMERISDENLLTLWKKTHRKERGWRDL